MLKTPLQTAQTLLLSLPLLRYLCERAPPSSLKTLCRRSLPTCLGPSSGGPAASSLCGGSPPHMAYIRRYFRII